MHLYATFESGTTPKSCFMRGKAYFVYQKEIDISKRIKFHVCKSFLSEVSI